MWRSHTTLCRVHRDIEVRVLGLGHVDSTRAVTHLRELWALGIGSRQMQNRTGVSFSRIERIRVGEHVKIRAATETAILSVAIPGDVMQAISDDAFMSSIGTVRRLQALRAIGYTNDMLAAETGLTNETICAFVTGKRPFSKGSTARNVRDTFNRLQMTSLPETYGTKRARLAAERKGWAPPLDWEDIDDPDAKPFVAPKHKPRASFLEEYENLIDTGYHPNEIAREFGITQDALDRRLSRRAA